MTLSKIILKCIIVLYSLFVFIFNIILQNSIKSCNILPKNFEYISTCTSCLMVITSLIYINAKREKFYLYIPFFVCNIVLIGLSLFHQILLIGIKNYYECDENIWILNLLLASETIILSIFLVILSIILLSYAIFLVLDLFFEYILSEGKAILWLFISCWIIGTSLILKFFDTCSPVKIIVGAEIAIFGLIFLFGYHTEYKDIVHFVNSGVVLGFLGLIVESKNCSGITIVSIMGSVSLIVILGYFIFVISIFYKRMKNKDDLEMNDITKPKAVCASGFEVV